MCVPRRVCSTRGVPRRPSPSVGTPARSPRCVVGRHVRPRVPRARRRARGTSRGADGARRAHVGSARRRWTAVVSRRFLSDLPNATSSALEEPDGFAAVAAKEGRPPATEGGGRDVPVLATRDGTARHRDVRGQGGSRWDDGSGRRGRSSIRSGSAGEGGARQTRPPRDPPCLARRPPERRTSRAPRRRRRCG